MGGQPDFDPATLNKRSHTEYVIPEESDLERMLAERIVISTYQESSAGLAKIIRPPAASWKRFSRMRGPSR